MRGRLSAVPCRACRIGAHVLYVHVPQAKAKSTSYTLEQLRSQEVVSSGIFLDVLCEAIS